MTATPLAATLEYAVFRCPDDQMDAALAQARKGRPAALDRESSRARLIRAGTSSGINIAPGCDDDGWIVPLPVRLGDGTSVQLLKDGEGLHAAYEAIREARRRICLEVYIFRDDDTGRAFAELLMRKAREGVAVHLIYDSYGSMSSDRDMFRAMARAGVRLAEFHPINPWRCHFSWRPVNRDHRKLLIVDDEWAWMGGLNVGAEYAGSWVVLSRRHDCPWRDNAVSLRGPGARLLLTAFARSWRYIHRGGRISTAQLLHDEHSGELGLIASVPTRSSPIQMFQHAVRGARRSILLTMAYFAPPDVFIGDLVAAARRGVRTRLMLPGICDVPLMITAARGFYDRLLDAGVEISERQGAVLHAKTMCVDEDLSIVGSANLDYQSIEMNMEISLLIRNRAFAAQLHQLFENDVRFARRIAPREWRRRPRPIWDRIVMWAVDRARRLL